MKKVFIIIIMLLFAVTVKAASNDSEVEVRLIPNVYFNYKKGNTIYWAQFGYIYANDNIAYCYDIESVINTSIYSSADAVSATGKTVLAGYFGYGYKDNNTLEDYMATQQIIWGEQGISVYYTTESGGEGNIIDVSAYKNKILNYGNNYKIFPDFEGLFKFDLGTSNIIKDKSNILNSFLITNPSGNSISISNNNLIIDTYLPGDFSFSLKTNYSKRYDNKIYTATNSQTLIQIGRINQTFNSYSYSVSSGTLEVNLYDKNTNSISNSGSSTFKGNIFNLYDSNRKLIGKYETLEDGRVYVNNLTLGSYTLEHTKTSEGYNEDKKSYEFEIKSNNIHKSIDIYLNPLIIQVNIKKTYGNPVTNTIYYDDNVVFRVTNSKGETIKEISTDINGECSISLVYDDYIISQINTNRVNKRASEYVVNKNNFNEVQNYNIYDPIYNSKVKVYLYENISNAPIPNMEFLLNSNRYFTNETGYFLTDYLEEGEYILNQQVSDEYKDITSIEFSINKDSSFYLENGDTYMDIILYNEKKIKEEAKAEDSTENHNNTTDEDNTEVDSENNPSDSDKIISTDMDDNVKDIVSSKQDEIINDNTENIKEIDNNDNPIEKLPNLGIFNIKILYMIVFFFRGWNVKKINC